MLKNNSLKTSIIDHIYVKDHTEIKNLISTTPPFGDHKLIKFETLIERKIENEIWKWNLKFYPSEKLNETLLAQNWQIKTDSVWSYLNEFESKLVDTVNKLAPFEPWKQIEIDKTKPPVQNKQKKLNVKTTKYNPLQHWSQISLKVTK